jgi:hypothetical protein
MTTPFFGSFKEQWNARLGEVPGMWSGATAVDGTTGSWLSASVGALYLRLVSSTETRLYVKKAATGATTDWQVLYSTNGAKGFIDVPLASLRELASNDIVNVAGDAGVLAVNSTPILQKVNGATDGAMRLAWAASNNDLVSFQFSVPPDLDDTADVSVKVRAASAGTTDTPTIGVDSWWGFGDTKIADATAAVTGTTIATYTATIAAADVDAANTCTINFTPAAHTTDILYVYAIWLEYSKK